MRSAIAARAAWLSRRAKCRRVKPTSPRHHCDQCDALGGGVDRRRQDRRDTHRNAPVVIGSQRSGVSASRPWRASAFRYRYGHDPCEAERRYEEEMNPRSPYMFVPCLIIVFVLAMSDRVVAEDSLAAARELYSSAPTRGVEHPEPPARVECPWRGEPAIEQYPGVLPPGAWSERRGLEGNRGAYRHGPRIVRRTPIWRPACARRSATPGVACSRDHSTAVRARQKRHSIRKSTQCRGHFRAGAQAARRRDVGPPPPSRALRSAHAGGWISGVSAKGHPPPPLPAPTPVAVSVVEAQPAPDVAPLPPRTTALATPTSYRPSPYSSSCAVCGPRRRASAGSSSRSSSTRTAAVESAAMREAAHAGYDRLFWKRQKSGVHAGDVERQTDQIPQVRADHAHALARPRTLSMSRDASAFALLLIVEPGSRAAEA